MSSVNIAMAQIKCQVGAIKTNVEKIIVYANRAKQADADIVVFPELTITGYPPEDLLLVNDFIQQAKAAIEYLKQQINGIAIVVGFPEKVEGKLYNALAVIENGKILTIYRKYHLPNYGVFDEKRYFERGTKSSVVEIKQLKIGFTICEDLWLRGPVCKAAELGAQIIININASPYQRGKTHWRNEMVKARIAKAQVPIVYVNLVGGQDELVFDGRSFAMDADQRVCLSLPGFVEDMQLLTINNAQLQVSQVQPELEKYAEIYQALVLGVSDYVKNNHFKGAILGLSGGIDSALTLAIAVDALGCENIEAFMMPSKYTADMSLQDAEQEAKRLNVEYQIISIKPLIKVFETVLSPVFSGLEADVTEENIQARCRGVILMAISNKKGKILLTTGNKSEMAVGYATLYGDMAGGFAPLKDVPKTWVYELANYRNRLSKVIPQRVIDRPPSAELAEDQTDQDSLPDYPILDAILAQYIEENKGLDDIVKQGYSKAMVKDVIRRVDLNEYKRRQAPPGIKITTRAFGRDRRYPITSDYKK